jgi:hypothetical protein
VKIFATTAKIVSLPPVKLRERVDEKIAAAECRENL